VWQSCEWLSARHPLARNRRPRSRQTRVAHAEGHTDNRCGAFGRRCAGCAWRVGGCCWQPAAARLAHSILPVLAKRAARAIRLAAILVRVSQSHELLSVDEGPPANVRRPGVDGGAQDGAGRVLVIPAGTSAVGQEYPDVSSTIATVSNSTSAQRCGPRFSSRIVRAIPPASTVVLDVALDVGGGQCAVRAVETLARHAERSCGSR
jgi:hypothetical protein